MKIPDTDTQFESHTIKSIQKGKDGHSLTFEDGWSFYMPPADFEPEIGQPVRLYGHGIGYIVRGLVVNGRVVFYHTEAEQEEKNQADIAERDAKQRADYQAALEEINRRIKALPPLFQVRLRLFREFAPPGWRYKYEAYELFTCEQAVAFADALKTPEEIKRFHAMSYPEQKKLVPAFSEDHSGNTFGKACELATIYLTDHAFVPNAHGALCPLVGCKDYGCHSIRTYK